MTFSFVRLASPLQSSQKWDSCEARKVVLPQKIDIIRLITISEGFHTNCVDAIDLDQLLLLSTIVIFFTDLKILYLLVLLFHHKNYK